MKLREFSTAAERRNALEKETGKRLKDIGKFSFDEEQAAKKNIENLVGAAQIPLGVAGPLQVNGKDYYLPLATTEGALVASVNRGCSATNKAGGVKAIVLKDAMTRGPMFKAKSIEQAKEFVDWIKNNFNSIAAKAEQGSRFLKINKIRPWIIGRNIYLRFECSTGDAMGMNMVTIGVHQACEYIAKETNVDYLTVSANMCIDKKPSALNMIEGRGKSVVAEAVLSKEIVEKLLKCDVDSLVDLAYRKNLLGSAQAGSYGFNMHVANTVAAMYIALGQDPAQVVNASIGFSLFEKVDDGLHVSLTLPALEVGTVGGGTGLATQREALELLGVKNAKELAEVICAAALAGELSGMAAEASHQLARAHKEHGR